MLEWLRNQFLLNKQLLHSLRDSERALQAISGENAILRQWNEELKMKVSQYEKMFLGGEATSHKPVQRVENWRTARQKLEHMHHPPVDWKAKEDKEITEGKLDV